MIKNNTRKKITIDGLARMVAKGFEQTPTKQEFTGLRQEFTGLRGEFTGLRQEMRSGFQILTDSLDLIRSDIRDLKISVEIDARDLKRRVERLEQRMGIEV